LSGAVELVEVVEILAGLTTIEAGSERLRNG
jgi:hypothetical protein